MNESLLLDFAADDTEAGYRLQQIEVFNWGTFDSRISVLHLDGLNTLVTGENGSGKSTFIDALTTLLMPANRIAYNRAAGADSKERDLRSYVLGHYRSEYNESTGGSKPVALRPKGTYSVILGVFRNVGFDATVTIAQVFYDAQQGQPKRFYVIAEEPMGIASHFRNFTDIRALKNQLRQNGADVFDEFSSYSPRLRRLLGIQSEQALDLFHQTVSMKAVGNLTDFVRSHILDPKPIADRLKELIAHFDDLTKAHDAVIAAKNQIQLLTPIEEEHQRAQTETAQATFLRQCRDQLRAYFERLTITFLVTEIDRLSREQTRVAQQVDHAAGQRRDAQQQIDTLKAAIAGSGGDELARIAQRIDELATERDRRRFDADQFQADARIAGVAFPSTADEFVDVATIISERRVALELDESKQQERTTKLSMALSDARTRHTALDGEIENLRSQNGNIPRVQIDLRRTFSTELSIDVADLPFAGELLRVVDGEDEWEGAAERLLHNFALSMLVPDEHYAAVQQWVDRHHLGQRLVYFRVPTTTRERDDELHRFAMMRKLEVRSGLSTSIDRWVRAELLNRANVACCDTPEQFRRESRAITKAGQIKSGNQRHEKDDRRLITDRSQYVLGWSNDAKISLLAVQLADIATEAQAIGAQLATAQTASVSSRGVRESLARLEALREYRQIDWPSIAGSITTEEERRQNLLATSDRLRELESQLADAQRAADAADNRVAEATRKAGAIEAEITTNVTTKQELTDGLENDIADGTVTFDPATTEYLETRASEILTELPHRVKQLTDAESAIRERLTGDIDATEKRLSRTETRLVGHMKDFVVKFPVESSELDASLDATLGYLEILIRLRADDLPQFEARFRKLLSENTLNEIASFQHALHREQNEIEERIDRINASLATIEYNRGRYIALVKETSREPDIKQFRDDMRACTEGGFNTSDDLAAAEQTFLQVRELIQRFRGRTGFTDIDRRWTARVTDVRNWFTFGASERWRSDNTEHERYSDSAGKSGGQKEKLAYTVLAAGLAYQFGLELGETTSRSFRFVAIDEAFGRADTAATQFGLELFARLHLQLLVVTPMQRISIIEPFVRRVGFVSMNDDRSQITNLTIEDYRKQRQAYTER
jgi:uncharacterized protein YPO0396